MWKIILGKGIEKEVITFVLHYAFMDLGLVRIYALYLVTNMNSMNACKRCVFKEEGILRKAVLKNGKYQNL